jgi:hypothetical protein
MGWFTQNDSTGSKHYFFMQEKDNSCGAAAALTMLRMLTGKKLNGGSMREAFSKSEGAKYTRSDGVRDFDSIGSDAAAISSALKLYGSKGWYRTPYSKNAVANITRKSPRIFRIVWGLMGDEDQGAHWVVASNTINDGDKLVCLCPAYGLVEVDADNLPWYVARQGHAKVADVIRR